MGTAFENFVNTELPIRQVLLKGSYDPRIGIDGSGNGTRATIGTYFKRLDTGDRFEKFGPLDTDWIITTSGSGIGAGAAEGIVVARACAPGAQVGDFVMESKTITNGVDVCTSNDDSRAMIGVIIAKPDVMSAHVKLMGRIEGNFTLTKGENVFLSLTGSATSVVPETGWVQVIGTAIDPNCFDLNPAISRIRRTAS